MYKFFTKKRKACFFCRVHLFHHSSWWHFFSFNLLSFGEAAQRKNKSGLRIEREKQKTKKRIMAFFVIVVRFALERASYLKREKKQKAA